MAVVVVVVVVCVCGVASVVWHAENPDSKRPSVYIQNVPVFASNTRTCFSTCAHVAGIHGDVLNAHMEAFWMDTRESSPVLLTKKSTRRVLTWSKKFTKETLGSYTFSV